MARPRLSFSSSWRAALCSALARQSARALSPAVVLRLREEDLYDVMEDHFELARSVMRYLATQQEQALEAAEAAQALRAAEATQAAQPET